MWLQQSISFWDKSQDFDIETLCKFLFEFTKIFKKMGKLLSIAFNDIIEKVGILRERAAEYKLTDLLKLVQHEIENDLIKYANNNHPNLKYRKDKKSKKHPISATRSMLRMIWFMDYLFIMFSELNNDRQQNVSQCCLKAYNLAFGNRHATMVRLAAQAAIRTAPNRKKLLGYLSNNQKDEAFVYDYIQKIVPLLLVIKGHLWSAFKKLLVDELP